MNSCVPFWLRHDNTSLFFLSLNYTTSIFMGRQQRGGAGRILRPLGVPHFSQQCLEGPGSELIYRIRCMFSFVKKCCLKVKEHLVHVDLSPLKVFQMWCWRFFIWYVLFVCKFPRRICISKIFSLFNFYILFQSWKNGCLVRASEGHVGSGDKETLQQPGEWFRGGWIHRDSSALLQIQIDSEVGGFVRIHLHLGGPK